MRIIFALLALCLAACKAQTYEDCILENIKDAEAAYETKLIESACREKHPTMVNVEQLDGSFKQERADSFFGEVTEKISLDVKNNHFDRVKIELLNEPQNDGDSNINVTNYSPWDIKSLTVGIVSNSNDPNCPADILQYSRFISCKPESYEGHIDENSSGRLYCDDVIQDESYCLVTIHLNN